MDFVFINSDLTNCQEIDEFNSQQNSIFINCFSNNILNDAPNNISFDNPSETLFGNPFPYGEPFGQTHDNNYFTNEKNISSPNETDQALSQKKTSDKSTNNSNHITKDKHLKLDLNEGNEKDSSSSQNQKANIINPNTLKGPFNISKEKKLGRKTKNSCRKGVHDKFSYDNMTKN